MSREKRREEEALELAKEQSDEAVEVTETDDSSTDPNHRLEAEEEPS